MIRIILANVILANCVAMAVAQTVPVIEQTQVNLLPAGEVANNALLPMTSIPASPFALTGGGSFILMAPRFESNPAYTTTTIRTQGPGAPNLTQRTVQEFSFEYAPAMRYWLGVELGNGYGVRGRWFRYDQSSQTLDAQNAPIPLGSPILAQTIAGTSPLMAIGPQTGLPAVFSLQAQGAPGTTDQLQFKSRLYFDVWDMEGTISNLQLGQLSIQVAGGVRYARINQIFSSTLTGNSTQFLNSEQSFQGVGPTVEVAGQAPFNLLNLSAFGSFRLSMLYGNDEHRVYGTNLGLTPPFVLGSHDDFSSRYRFVPAVDMETGVQKTWNLDRADLFLQASVIAQLWPIGGGAQPNGNMSMIGFAFGGGLRY